MAPRQFDDSTLLHCRLGAEVDRPELFKFIGIVMQCVVKRFSQVARDFGLGLLVILDRFAPIQPRDGNIIQIIGASAMQSGGLQRKHGFADVAFIPVHHHLVVLR